jgi:DNA-binding protein Fis
MRVLEHFAGSRKKAAATLGIDKSTLWRKLQQYGRPRGER